MASDTWDSGSYTNIIVRLIGGGGDGQGSVVGGGGGGGGTLVVRIAITAATTYDVGWHDYDNVASTFFGTGATGAFTVTANRGTDGGFFVGGTTSIVGADATSIFAEDGGDGAPGDVPLFYSGGGGGVTPYDMNGTPATDAAGTAGGYYGGGNGNATSSPGENGAEPGAGGSGSGGLGGRGSVEIWEDLGNWPPCGQTRIAEFGFPPPEDFLACHRRGRAYAYITD